LTTSQLTTAALLLLLSDRELGCLYCQKEQGEDCGNCLYYQEEERNNKA